MNPLIERRLLQMIVAMACIVPITAGLAGVLYGPNFFLVLCKGQGAVSLDSHFHYLSGLLLAIGLAFLSLVPRIETETARFHTLAFLVVIGGLARIFAAMQMGLPDMPDTLAIGMEVGVVPLLAWWQSRVARIALTLR